MNKLKVATQALREYLGADEQGIRLLGEITSIANEQRKRNALLESSSLELSALVESLRSEAAKAKNDALAAREELRSQSSRLSAAEAREVLLGTEIENLRRALEPQPELNLAQVDRFTQLMSQVKRRFSKLPPPSQLELEDLVHSYSHDQFAGLGMVVALCAIMDVPVRIKSRHVMRDAKGWAEAPDNHKGTFVRWFTNWIKWEGKNADLKRGTTITNRSEKEKSIV